MQLTARQAFMLAVVAVIGFLGVVATLGSATGDYLFALAALVGLAIVVGSELAGW